MKIRTLIAALLLGSCFLGPVSAQEVSADLKAVAAKVGVKARAGKDQPADYAEDFAALDQLLAKYPAKDAAGAEILFLKAVIYAQVIEDEAAARKLLATIKADYPGTPTVSNVDRMLAGFDRAAQAKLVVAKLIGQPAPELHFNWASQDGLKNLSALKGQVVVLDFWATWCGPCLSSFPKVREHVAHFQGSPVTFLGVTSIQGFVANLEPKKIDTKGDPAREMSLMPAFMKAKEMTWGVAFSEEQVFNPDYGVQGIPYIAIIAPDGTVRHAGLNPHDPKADIAAKVEAILKEFKLPVPVAKI